MHPGEIRALLAVERGRDLSRHLGRILEGQVNLIFEGLVVEQEHLGTWQGKIRRMLHIYKKGVLDSEKGVSAGCFGVSGWRVCFVALHFACFVVPNESI